MTIIPQISLHRQFRHFLGIAIVLLAIAYIPLGWWAAGVGVRVGWDMAVRHRNIWELLLGVWWVAAAIVGNLQILLCLASPLRENRFLQNPVLKIAAIVGQLSWLPVAFLFYSWYFWFFGSIVLFTITPRSGLLPNGNPYAARQDWKDSRILSRLRKTAVVEGQDPPNPLG